MYKKVKIFIVVFVLFLTSCTKTSSRLAIVFDHGPLSLDPHIYSEIVTTSILSNFYEPLVQFDPDMKIRPQLAESWENPDSLTWIFHLRPNIVSCNGQKLTSLDVVKNFERILNLSHSDIKTDLAQIDTFYARDSFTFVVKTRSPFPIMLDRLTSVLIVPSCNLDSVRKIIRGTGSLIPVRVDSCCIKARPNPRYHGKMVSFDHVSFYFTGKPDESSGKTGNTFYIFVGSKRLYKDSLTPIKGPLVATRYIGIDLHKRYLNKLSFRKALYYAVKRQEIIDSVIPGMAIPSYQFPIPLLLGHIDTLKLKTPSIKTLIAQSGYKGEPIPLILSQNKLSYGYALQRQYKKYGINIRLVPLNARELFHRVKIKDFSLFLLGSIPTTGDAWDQLEVHFHTYDAMHSSGLGNYVGYSNPEFDSIIDMAGRALDRKKRAILLQQANYRIVEDIPVVPICYEGTVFYVSKGIMWKPRLDRSILVNEIRIRK